MTTNIKINSTIENYIKILNKEIYKFKISYHNLKLSICAFVIESQHHNNNMSKFELLNNFQIFFNFPYRIFSKYKTFIISLIDLKSNYFKKTRDTINENKCENCKNCKNCKKTKTNEHAISQPHDMNILGQYLNSNVREENIIFKKIYNFCMLFAVTDIKNNKKDGGNNKEKKNDSNNKKNKNKIIIKNLDTVSKMLEKFEDNTDNSEILKNIYNVLDEYNPNKSRDVYIKHHWLRNNDQHSIDIILFIYDKINNIINVKTQKYDGSEKKNRRLRKNNN